MSYYVHRDAEADAQEGVDAFDAAYFARFGRFPEESSVAALPSDSRLAAIQALVEHGATEGEREAARSALARLQQDARDEDDYLDALHAGEV